MPRWVDLDNPKIIKEGRDKFGNVLYGIPPDTKTVDVRPVVRVLSEVTENLCLDLDEAPAIVEAEGD